MLVAARAGVAGVIALMVLAAAPGCGRYVDGSAGRWRSRRFRIQRNRAGRGLSLRFRLPGGIGGFRGLAPGAGLAGGTRRAGTGCRLGFLGFVRLSKSDSGPKNEREPE